jgi:hypothetical protein
MLPGTGRKQLKLGKLTISATPRSWLVVTPLFHHLSHTVWFGAVSNTIFLTGNIPYCMQKQERYQAYKVIVTLMFLLFSMYIVYGTHQYIYYMGFAFIALRLFLVLIS